MSLPRSLKRACMLFAILMVSLAAPVFAQFDAASVLGYVRDSAGASVANATVVLTNQDTGVALTTRADAAGRYEFTSVKIGNNYKVAAEASGFAKTDSESFALTVNARQRVDLGLKTGAVTETVDVSSAPTLLETETSSRGQVIGTRQVEDLPLNGRSYADLALLVPGVRKSVLENTTTSSREASYNVNGQRSAFNNFLLDGLDNNSYGTSNQGFANENIPPSPDAVGEFRIETDNYSAEYGRASGAVINVSIRRGTNGFHGRLWDYLRNTDLNAIGPFTPAGNVKPIFIRNQFGGTFGGPIKHDRTFFFADYEGVRQIFSNQSTTVTLPNAEQRASTFNLRRFDGSSTPIPLTNPITGLSYLTGSLPSSATTPFARDVLSLLPANTVTTIANNAGVLSGITNNFNTLPRGTIQDNKGDIRVDHTFTEKMSVFGRYSEHREQLFDPPTILGPDGGNANGNVAVLNRQIVGGITRVLSSTSLFDVRFEYSHNLGGKTPYNVGQPSLLVQNGITDGLPTDPTIVRSLNGQNITGFTQLGAQTSNPQFQNPDIYDPKANYTFIHGIHSFKIGYEYQAVNTQINDFNPSYGQDNYNNSYAGAGFAACTTAGQAGCTLYDPAATTANANTATRAAAASAQNTQLQQARNLADFLFGNRSSYSLTNFTVVNLRQRFNFMYIQDDMKVTSNLTINAGIRYELATPQWERDNKLANFDPRSNSLVQATAGDIYNRSLVNLPVKNVGPRFGLAYSATPTTVIRAGYGVNFTQYNRAGGENNLTYNGPDVVNATINQIAPTTGDRCATDTQLQTTCFRQTQQGYSNILTSPANFNPLTVTTRYIPRNFATGYIQSYFLGMQKQLPHSIVLDLAYVGNKGTHLQVLADYNQATPCALATGCPTVQARRPVANFGEIEVAYGGGTSNYNALQFKVEKRAVQGLYLLNSFTYSRTFDLSAGHLETAFGDNSRVNFANPSGDYGRSSYDQPLNDTTSVLYDLPYGHGRRFGASSNYAMDALLGGWQLTLINTATSGVPVNLVYNINTNSGLFVTDLYTYRANIVGPVVAAPSNRKKTATTLNGYFNTGSTAIPTGTPFGNAQRNGHVGPSYESADLGLHKQFPLWNDNSKFDFRAEAFNVFNFTNYAPPDGNLSDGTFGAITTINGAPRQLQVAAKILF